MNNFPNFLWNIASLRRPTSDKLLEMPRAKMVEAATSRPVTAQIAAISRNQNPIRYMLYCARLVTLSTG